MTGTWILLRGLTRDSRHWGDFLARFQRTIPGSTVIALDLPGNGALNHLASPADVREMAQHCRDQAFRRALAPPYNVLAMSLGAMVAVAWAHAHPEDIARCVLINTSLRPFSPFYRRLRPANYLPLLKLMLRAPSARQWEETILLMTSRLRPGAGEVLDEWIELRRAHRVSLHNALRQLYAAARYRAPRERPAAALLLLASEHDGLVHAGCSRTLAGLWGCEFRVHPQAGHDLPLDDGPWVAEQVRRWLAEFDGSPPAPESA